MSAPALLATAVATLAIALPVAVGATVVEAAHRAAGAADAAALAAADAASGWAIAEPCDLATEVSGAVRADVFACDVDLASGQVRLRVGVQTMLGTVTAQARAGPPQLMVQP